MSSFVLNLPPRVKCSWKRNKLKFMFQVLNTSISIHQNGKLKLVKWYRNLECVPTKPSSNSPQTRVPEAVQTSRKLSTVSRINLKRNCYPEINSLSALYVFASVCRQISIQTYIKFRGMIM